jgi:hypothetical protein
MKFLIAISASAFLFAAHASAQSIYVDLQGGTPLPSSAYGAAYGVPGTWNGLITEGFFPMVGADGNPTSVIAEVINACGGPTSCLDAQPSFCASQGGTCDLTGDDGALLGDWWRSDCVAAPPRIWMHAMAPGTYQFFSIGYDACQPVHTAQISGPGGTHPSGGGVPFTGTWEDFPVGVFTFTLTGSTDGFILTIPNTQSGGIAGFQIVRLGDAPTPYCFGFAGRCPCGVGLPERGCPSSFNSAGGRLEGAGVASLAADSFVLSASGLSESAVTIIQGTSAESAGLGLVFGDGLLCAGGSILRMSIQFAAGGAFTYPTGATPPISVAGLVPPGGGLRTYQAWYRDSPSYCTSATFNLTNAIAVQWH